MTKSVKVTVILTSYNHEKNLQEAIDSVLHQTFSNFELIIWDDASTDFSWQIIKRYTDPRIKSFRNDKNRRANYGISKSIREEIARGEYIAIHHSDDVWEHDKLEKQVSFLDAHPKIGAVFTQANIIDDDGQPLQDKTHFYAKVFEQPNRTRHEWLNYFFYHGNALCHPSVLIRKKCYEDVGLYRYGMAQVTDFDMWIRLCLKHEIYVFPEKLVRFRVRTDEGNISGNRPEARVRMPFEYLQVYSNYRDIKDPDDLIKVFPFAKKYFKQEGFDLGYILGMIALEEKTSNIAKLFGLQLLFEILNNPERAKKAYELYGFNHVDFIAQTAKYDVFSVELISSQMEAIQEFSVRVSEKEQQVSEKEQQVSEKEQQVDDLNSQLSEIFSSRSWRLVHYIQKIRAVFVPVGSKIEKILGLGNKQPQNQYIDEQQIRFSVDVDFKQPFITGNGNVFYLTGWCYHPTEKIRQLFLLVNEKPFRISNHSYGRPDTLRDQASYDPSGNSLLSGFWGVIPFGKITVPQKVELSLLAELGNGKKMTGRLGSLQLLPFVEEPIESIKVLEKIADEPLVAICMATYNPPLDLFEKQVKSIIGQSHKNWICIITDDLSTDDYFQKILEIAGQDKRFFIRRNKTRLGVYHNFERSLTYVPKEAEFVAFSDQDDEWYPDKLEKSLNAFESEDDLLVYCDMDIVTQDGKILSRTFWTSRRNNYKSLETLLFANTVTGAASVFRARLLQDILPFPHKISDAYHDHWVACTALSKGNIKYINTPLYAYTQHGGNAYGYQDVQSFSLLPEVGRIASWLRSFRVFRGEAGNTFLYLDEQYFNYLTRLILIANVLASRNPSSKNGKIINQFTSFERSVTGLILHSIKYKVFNRPTLGYEIHSLRSYIAHHLLRLYYKRNRAEIHFQTISAAPNLIEDNKKSDKKEKKLIANIAGMVTQIQQMIAPLTLNVSSTYPKRVNILMATINFKYVFGGYIAMFQFAKKIAELGYQVRIVIVEPCDYDPRKWKHEIRSYPGIEDLFDIVETSYHYNRTIPLDVNPDDVFIATSCWTAHIAHKSAWSLGKKKIIFLAQEYEPVFFPKGTFSALSHQSYFFPQYSIFSTDLLQEYFKINQYGIYASGEKIGNEQSIFFRNAINQFNISEKNMMLRKKKKFLFYARPEPHAARNMFELGVLGLVTAIERGCFDLNEWEFHGIGTIGNSKSMRLTKDAELKLLPKVSLQEYVNILPTYDLGLSLMLSPHPSLTPIDMAAAGMLAITNTYANKTEDKLTNISSNIVVVPPTIDGINAGVVQAISRLNNYTARLNGSRVNWPQDWSMSFNDDFTRKLQTFIKYI